jgi:hypothetical protein
MATVGYNLNGPISLAGFASPMPPTLWSSLMRPYKTHLIIAILSLTTSHLLAGEPFVIHIKDAQSGRGIPLAKLTTTNGIELITDSAGVACFDEPGLMDGKVYFSVSSPGYSYPKDGFGNSGRALDIKAGGSFTFKMTRTQIAQRLYRITGQGIYHHSTRAGLPTPMRHPNLNGRVMGQDTVMAVAHDKKIYWFWGDTARPGYPLGHFGTAMATSISGDQLNPAQGIELNYVVNKKGFSRPVFRLGKPGVVWFHGVTEIKDPNDKKRIIGHYSRLKGLGHLLEHGIAAFNKDAGEMEVVSTFPLDAPLHPFGQTLRHSSEGVEYIYFCTPYPHTRVRATWNSFRDPDQYEAYTPLKPGTQKLNLKKSSLERNGENKVVYGWKKSTAKVSAIGQRRLIASGALQQTEALIQTVDASDNQSISLATGSVRWNDLRKRWIMIACRQGGKASFLGEIYYAESKQLLGPWPKAIKVATHPGYAFYNPVHHAFLDRDDGRSIYFEGTYTKQFSKTKTPTPRYNYNQIMYKIDLGDPKISKALGTP